MPKTLLSESTVRDFEKARRLPTINNLAAIRRALESAGVEFIAENGGGAGARLGGSRYLGHFRQPQ
jgi:hypothetical protein